MTEVRAHVRAAPGGAFVNVARHNRRSGRYYATVTLTSEGYAQVFVIDRNTNASRTLFIGDPVMARGVAHAINTGAVRPREGLLR